jgi:hypothetical protein
MNQEKHSAAGGEGNGSAVYGDLRIVEIGEHLIALRYFEDPDDLRLTLTLGTNWASACLEKRTSAALNMVCENDHLLFESRRDD